MRIQINTNGIYEYLTTSPKLDGEEWKTGGLVSPKPFVNLSFGDAQLPSPLGSLGIKFTGNGINYSAHAFLLSAKSMDRRRLSLEFTKRMPKGYELKAMGGNRVGAYIYNGKEISPSFAFRGGKVEGGSGQHAFLFHMGAHGARAREIGSEAAFIEEVFSFQDIVSYFVNSCLVLRRKIKKPARKIEVPSLLELTCMEASYSF